MRIFNRYLIFLALATTLANIALIYSAQKDLGVFFTINIIIFLAITILHAFLNPAARRALGVISVVLFAGFAVIVTIRVIEVISAG